MAGGGGGVGPAGVAIGVFVVPAVEVGAHGEGERKPGGQIEGVWARTIRSRQ